MKIKIILLFLSFAVMCKSQDTCTRVKVSDFPKKDLPPANFKLQNYNGKTSENYYYGIGVPINYVTARYLAFKEMEDSANETVLDGSTVLLMLYANGYGVKRDLDICIRLACANVGGAPAEIEGRTKHLKDMKSGKSAGFFDICDDVTSGNMEGMCASIYSDKLDYHRQGIIDSILKTWTQKDVEAYKRLRKVATSFFEAREENEVDLSGTGRYAFELEELDSLESNFLDKILKVGKCLFQDYSADDFVKADEELNIVYSKVMRGKDTIDWGTVTKEQIKLVERKWIPYRDVWVSFSCIRCPNLSESALKTLLTKERITQLKEFLPYKHP